MLATGLSLHERRIAELTSENDTLRERVRQLEDALRVPKDNGITRYMLAFGLTMTEARVLHVLLSKDGPHTQAFLDAVWGGGNDLSSKILPAMIMRLRRRFRPRGITIDTLWAHGYRMSPADKAKLQGHMDDWDTAGQPCARPIGAQYQVGERIARDSETNRQG